jgi:hypothetical protein
VPLPKADDSVRLGFFRTLALALLSAIGGVLLGFIGVNAFAGWTRLTSRFGPVLLAVGALICIAITIRRLAPDTFLDLKKAAQSATPAWKHSRNWSFALGVSFMNFGKIPNFGRLAIAHAAKWAIIDFVVFYTLTVLVHRVLTPSRWEREA